MQRAEVWNVIVLESEERGTWRGEATVSSNRRRRDCPDRWGAGAGREGLTVSCQRGSQPLLFFRVILSLL